MNVKELKTALEGLPDDMQVYVCGGKTEFNYGLLNRVFVEDIINGDEMGCDDIDDPEVITALILDEE